MPKKKKVKITENKKDEEILEEGTQPETDSESLVDDQVEVLEGEVVPEDELPLDDDAIPVEEKLELLKAALFLYLIRKINFTYFVDGAIYGFAIGIGFAIVENYEYILAYQDIALSVAISRVISTNLIHGAATAMSGIAFGVARFYSGLKKGLAIFSGLLAAIILHFGFNNLVNEVSSSLLLLYAASVGLVSTLIIYFVIRKGLELAKTWIHR